MEGPKCAAATGRRPASPMDEQDRTTGTSGARERHRPNSHGVRRGTPEASGARENPPDFGRSAGLQRAAPCENYGPHPG